MITAVEWLERQIGSKISDANISISVTKFLNLMQQAKEIDKQNIMNAWASGVTSENNMTAEKYYNETFNK